MAIIALDSWPPSPKTYVALKAAGKIKFVPTERERERAMKQAVALLRAARQ